jgi:hypothetical protein
MRFFGKERWGDPEVEHMTVPVGAPCFHCSEVFDDGDLGVAMGVLKTNGLGGMTVCDEEPYHRECFLRLVVGSVAHQERRCTCFSGTASEDGEPRSGELRSVSGEDDPSLSKRQAAVVAVRSYERRAKS